jgi:hypothetical protein
LFRGEGIFGATPIQSSIAAVAILALALHNRWMRELPHRRQNRVTRLNRSRFADPQGRRAFVRGLGRFGKK